MKRIAEGFYLLLGFVGFVLCMCEAADFTQQIFVSVAGIAMMAIAALLISLLYMQESEEGLGTLYE